MHKDAIDDPTLQQLRQRLHPLHLRRRLGIEQEHEAQVFGVGRNFFHIENWYSIHSVIRGLLRLALVYRRGQRNATAIQVRENRFVLPHLPATFEGFTILQVSDLHLDMRTDIPHAIAEAVRGLKYDICVLTGDYRARTHGPLDGVLTALDGLRSSLNEEVYGILGNHDSIRLVPSLEGHGIRMLLNESVCIEQEGERIYLAGIDDAHYFRAENLEKAGHDIPEEGVSILLSHTPEIYRHAAHTGFDIMLSGHTHGGQICLPGGIPMMCNIRGPRFLCKGAWRYNAMQGYTSTGAGLSVVDVRLNCPPEVTLHRLTRGDGNQ